MIAWWRRHPVAFEWLTLPLVPFAILFLAVLVVVGCGRVVAEAAVDVVGGRS